VARYHRKSEPKAKHPEFAALTEEDQHLVRSLAGLLRVAIGLDRSHAGHVEDVAVKDTGRQLRILATKAGDADIGLEIYAATARKELLETALGLPVEVSEAL
jgi:exopolyphosphatase/guanosine-5'-triphosphate,3'-diphosphate pyrophosphatase